MKNSKFSVITYSNGATIWMYKDLTVSIEEIQQEGFFDPAKDLMAIGDIVYCIGSDTVKQLWVKSLNPVILEEMGK